MRTHMTLTISVTVLVLICGICGQTWAQEAPAPQLDPQAVQILQACLDRVKDAQTYTTLATLHMYAEMGGQNRAVTAAKFIVVEHPNRLALLPRGEAGGSTLICDGKRLYAMVPGLTRYVDDVAPATLDELVRRMDMRIVAGRFFLIDALVASDPYTLAMEDVSALEMLGEEEVNGALCDRLRVTQTGLKWDVWVEKGDSPAIREVAPDFTEYLDSRARATGKENPMKMTVEVFYDEWNFAPTIDPEWFAFDPPQGGNKQSRFIDSSRIRKTDSPLIGEPAPDFSLPLLDGEKMKLSDHKDKDVVILAFWTTYSKPCTDMLPVIAKLARIFRDKNVVLYAINQGDTLDDIRRFTEALGVDCPIALDTEDEVTGLYDAKIIPHTVVIGLDGTVQAVHAGFHPLLEEVLRQELETLASGGSLLESVEEPLPDDGESADTP